MVEKPPERLGIVLYVIFYMPMPKSWSKKRKIELDMKPHLIKSDLDNLLKMILDRAEGLLFDNDKRIYSIRAEKVYSDRPRIELTLNYDIV
jgi:Holliday junction resolvase RusA-like endonuclease